MSTECVQVDGSSMGGNITLAYMNSEEIFGKDDWTDLGKLNTTNGNDDLSNSNWGFTSNNSNTGGSWTLADFLEFDPNEHYAFALKGGSNGGLVYLMDTSVRSGTWSNAGLPLVGNGNTPGLSNLTLFGTGTLVRCESNDPDCGDTPPDVVPLPAAGWMLLAGIGGLAAMRRRRKA